MIPNIYAYSITDQIKILIFLDLDTGVNKLSHGTRNVQNMIAFNSPTDHLSNDTPYTYTYSTEQTKIIVFLILPPDTDVNKWSHGSRNAQIVVLFNFTTYNISNDTPYAYILILY